MKSDFRLIDHDSVVTVLPLTPEAEQFVDSELCVYSWQMVGNGFRCDRRTAEFLAELFHDAGLSIEGVN
jgi:hypothetical protein